MQQPTPPDLNLHYVQLSTVHRCIKEAVNSSAGFSALSGSYAGQREKRGLTILGRSFSGASQQQQSGVNVLRTGAPQGLDAFNEILRSHRRALDNFGVMTTISKMMSRWQRPEVNSDVPSEATIASRAPHGDRFDTNALSSSCESTAAPANSSVASLLVTTAVSAARPSTSSVFSRNCADAGALSSSPYLIQQHSDAGLRGATISRAESDAPDFSPRQARFDYFKSRSFSRPDLRHGESREVHRRPHLYLENWFLQTQWAKGVAAANSASEKSRVMENGSSYPRESISSLRGRTGHSLSPSENPPSHDAQQRRFVMKDNQKNASLLPAVVSGVLPRRGSSLMYARSNATAATTTDFCGQAPSQTGASKGFPVAPLFGIPLWNPSFFMLSRLAVLGSPRFARPTRFDILRAMWIDTAVTTIQRFYRGYQGRLKAEARRAQVTWLKRANKAAEVIQAHWRGWLGRKEAELELLIFLMRKQRETAAKLVQRAVRQWQRGLQEEFDLLVGTIARVRNRAATTVQRMWRGYRTRQVVDQEYTDWVVEWKWDGAGAIVEVVGDFTDPPWTKRLLMQWCPVREKYVCVMPRVPGHYELKFIVNGTYACDGSETVVSDGVGHFNNVIRVQPTPQEPPFARLRQRLSELMRAWPVASVT